jgi:hypothetical protein
VHEAKLRKLTGQLHKLTYETAKADMVAELPHEQQLFARAMQEHMHLKHVHNALEFADLQEGAPYEIEFEGDAVSPLAQSGCHQFYGSATIDRLLLVLWSRSRARRILSALSQARRRR